MSAAGVALRALVVAAISLAPAAAHADKKPPPLPPLPGATVDFEYDAAETGHKDRAWSGRAFVHQDVSAKEATPLLVFIPGMNTERIKYRWIGGGTEGDVRRIVADMIDAGAIPPIVVAGPSSTDAVTMSNAVLSWPAFDLDTFIDRTIVALSGTARIDRRRVVVAGHSGAGCNVKNGIASALLGVKRSTVLAGLVIDVCMQTDLATALNRVSKDTSLVVAWQEISWSNRPTTDFRRYFLRAAGANPPSPGVLRELELVRPNAPSPHDAMVPITLKKWLPRFFPKAARATSAATTSTGSGADAARP
ncbi:MAG TPA: hypothetical protein VGM56_27270 [Byssovorax sp.]